MRGADERSGSLFSYVDLEDRVRQDHPLRAIRSLANEALERLEADFTPLYSGIGRPSIPPQMLLRAMLLQAFYSVRSERQLMERMEFDLLFRWFVGLGIDEAVWDASSFSKNRDRLLDGEIASKFLNAVLAGKGVKRLLSSEHFSVDGTLIEAWASMKSFRPKADDAGPPDDAPPAVHGGGDSSGEGKSRNEMVDFKGEKRSNDTHESTTDADARLARKSNGQSAIMAYAGHGLMENRSGLIVGAIVTIASGTAERDAALHLIDACGRRRGQISLGADKGYDAAAFVDALRARKIIAHVARHDALTKTGKRRRSKISPATARGAPYQMSQRRRKLIEEAFGWIKTVAGLRKTKFRGRLKVDFAFTFAAAAYNLIRLPKLMAA
jgi:transposase